MESIKEKWHGTIGGYTNHKCRCDECKTTAAAHAAKYRAANREKRNAYQRKWRAENPEKARDLEARLRARYRQRTRQRTAEYYADGSYRSWMYGLERGQLDVMLESQGGKCAICGTEFNDSARTSSIHVDHDHACCAGRRSCGKCVRGLLCKACNDGLGRFRDDPARLLRAVDYLAASTL